tara:strand:+ start:3496 stop:3873 length:378 start_codon:yes stop_codon:yes gene_type:complete
MIITYNKKKYPDMTSHDLMAWGGLIPLWVMEWNLRKAMGVDITLFEHLHTQYEARAGMGIKGREMGGKINDEGIYQYPEDPPMQPYMTWETEAGTVYFYPYSVMGIPLQGPSITTGQTHYVARMD